MSIEVALSKLRSAQICHPNAVQFLIDEAITAIQQAEVTNELLHPEDFNVEVVMKPVVGFAPVSTQGVRVTHKPTGISVTCDAARSQHTNRHHAFEQLRAILAQQPATTEPVQTTPNFTQLMQILDGLNRCHSRDSKVEFLRSWIRDWTQHKVDKLTHPAPSVPDDAFDLICNAIDKADSITMEGDYMLDSDDCIAVVRVMQVLLSVRAAIAKATTGV